MIIVFLGQRNSGKTLSMTIELYKKYKQGYKIYSNYHLNFPYTPLTKDDLLAFAESGMYFNDCVFAIDEAHVWFDSYARSKAGMIFSYLLNQSSKQNLDIMLSTQFSRQIQIRIRLNTEIVVECSCRNVIWKTKDSKPIITENERPKPHDYKCSAYITNKIIKFSDTGADKITQRVYKGDKYYKLYDTREVIKQQKDIFQRAKEQDSRNFETRRATILTSKEKRLEQHQNRLFHEANRKKVMAE